ncbi:transcriptional regulator STERILE APETALA-like [Zingiber officinale]|uniref:transcriptional regulator STERILE APETALA-like n=1 Tax=Zingiber officinale TaxID=94328 RepID=UPI001C4B483F|nr:transcriptional regulator STERILE APETALA-like [Zingiber officinale]
MSSGSPPQRHGKGGGEEGASASRLGGRRTDYPSSSRQRSADVVWPEHFVESVAAHVADDAARSSGRLFAAPAVVAMFQVCPTWRAIAGSEFLWQVLCRRIWFRHRRSLPSWREEYIHFHRTAANFRAGRYVYSSLLPPSDDLSCRRLALSDRHLAAGFLDGSVRLYDVPSGRLLATFRADPHRDRLGRFSQAISGLVLLDDRLAFASQDGDVHVAELGSSGAPPRRALAGNLVVDGTMVDFTGNARWWVGLFAGAPGHSWHVWDVATELLVFVGGGLMDHAAVVGWHMLTDVLKPVVGRARILEQGVVVGCTVSSMEVLDLNGVTGTILNQSEHRHGALVGSFDACHGRVLVVDSRGVAEVREAPALTDVSRFTAFRRSELQQGGPSLEGCMNWGYALVCTSRGVQVWDFITGRYLYIFRQRIGIASAMVASNRYVVAWTNDTGLHLWDFGAL